MDLKITKYDPSVDSMPYQVAVSVDWFKNMTLLEAIQFAHEKTPIMFDYNCRGRQCGRCAVMLDGVPCMACCTFITDAVHTIEPLKGFPVLRDLIVDKREAHDALTARYNRVLKSTLQIDNPTPSNNSMAILQTMNDEFADHSKSHDENAHVIEQINAIDWCARCMACTAGCPAYNADPSSYVGPAEMLAIAYRFYDPYDEWGNSNPNGRRVYDAVRAGLWNCIMCGQCDKVCIQQEMKKVKTIWKDLRDAATAAGYPNPYA